MGPWARYSACFTLPAGMSKGAPWRSSRHGKAAGPIVPHLEIGVFPQAVEADEPQHPHEQIHAQTTKAAAMGELRGRIQHDLYAQAHGYQENKKNGMDDGIPHGG